MSLVIYHLAAALAVIVVQTTVLCHVPLAVGFYDPCLVVVAYLALFIPFGHALAIATLMGAAVDLVSAAPLGLYFFAYLWLFLFVRWSALFLHVKSLLVLGLVVTAMVIGQHLLLGALTALTAAGPVVGPDAPTYQGLWALGTGAAGIRILLYGRSTVQSRFSGPLRPSNGH